MGDTNDPWPPTPWRWPPDIRHTLAVLEELYPRAARRVQRRGLADDLAKDVAHTVYIELIDTPEGLAGCGSYESFQQTCSNRIDNAVRRLRRRGGGDDPLGFDPAVPPPGPDERSVEAQLADQLDEETMKVLLARRVEGQEVKQIAVRFGLSVNRVIKLLRNAQATLEGRGTRRGQTEGGS